MRTKPGKVGRFARQLLVLDTLLSALWLAAMGDSSSPPVSMGSGSSVRSSPLVKTLPWLFLRRWNIPVTLRVTRATDERRECVDALEPVPSRDKGVSTSTIVTDPVDIALVEALQPGTSSSGRRLRR